MDSIISGHFSLFFLFDVGEAIDRDQVRARIEATTVSRLAPRPATPSYVKYQQPPIAIDGDTLGLPDVEGFKPRFKTFDYGVVSVAFSRSVSGSWETVLADGVQWFDNARLAGEAERCCRVLLDRLGPAIVRPRQEFLAEDYVILHVRATNGPAASAVLSAHGSRIAQFLRGERDPLSVQERDEVLRHALSYLTTDLVVMTWNGAFVYDSEAGAQAALEILEFANSQLLEFRYYDQLLDAELGRIYRDLHQSGWLRSWTGRRYARAARQVHALFIDVNELTDKTENALKIAGDVYAARLFALAAARLGLDQWKADVREKLKTLDDIYRFAVEQTAMMRGEFLEITVVLILIIELVLLLAGLME